MIPTVLIMIACFLVAPVCMWIGYRAGHGAALDQIAQRQAAYATELRERWNNNSRLLRGRPSSTHLH